MAKSLQDQLLKAGLVTAHKAKQIKHEKHTLNKQPQVADEIKQLARQAQAEKVQRDRDNNRLQQQEAELKAVAAQIQQLIRQHRLDLSNGEIAYQFADDNKIKKIFITAAQRQQLAQGQLGIVKYETTYELVPAEIAEKIRQRDSGAVLALLSRQTAETTDQSYAGYDIPDDLIW